MTKPIVLDDYPFEKTRSPGDIRKSRDGAKDWETLRAEIRDRLVQLDKLARCGVVGDWEYALEEVNRKIARYNEGVPDDALKRPSITRESFVAELIRWQE